MRLGHTDFPTEVVRAALDGRLVVFAGAGVSMGPPANLPNFQKLADEIALGSGEVRGEAEPLDRFLGRLEHKRIQVHQRAAKRLSDPQARPTTLHKDLLQLFGEPSRTRIVTTNFDMLFEAAAREIWASVPEVYKAPALPLGCSFDGIVHVHGALPQALSFVLTDRDFGRAYLTEGWARRFLVDLFQSYTVLFVGYSYEDIVLRYLARAQPGGVGRRFALEKASSDAKGWELLGIELIPFPMPSENDFSCLTDGIQRFANFCQRNILDWQREISSAALEGPPTDIEYADMFRHALGDLVLTRFFVQSPRGIQWLGWLDENKLLDPLFLDDELDERCDVLALWIAQQFAIPHANSVFLLIGKHNLKLNSKLWWCLARHIANNKEQDLPADVLTKWISLLLHTAPNQLDHFVVHWLSEKCVELGQHGSALQLFEAMLDGRFTLKQPIAWLGESSMPETGARLEIQLGEHWTINEVWAKGLRPHLAVVAVPILRLCVKKLEERFTTYVIWNRSSTHWDSDSYGRAAIEPHDQDEYPEALDVIIDAARDSIEWIAQHRPSLLSLWYDQLINAEAPLLRRLAVHTLRCDKSLSSDRKVRTVLSGSLHDHQLRYEIFALLKDTYRETSEAVRVKLVDAIVSYQFPDEADRDRERSSAIERYQWLHWLNSADPICPIVIAAITEIRKKFPDVGAREYPDLTHWHSEADWRGPVGPWTVSELLARDPQECSAALLSFKEQAPFGPDSRDVAEAIREAVKQKPEWGLGLAQALVDEGQWRSLAWDALFRAWSDWPEDPAAATAILQWVKCHEAPGMHGHAVSQLLLALVKDGGRPYAVTMLSTANAIAKAVWLSIDRTPPNQRSHDDWLQDAINDPAGILSEFWVNSLSIAINKGELPSSKGLEAEYLEALNMMTDDETSAGYYARTILISQFAFLSGVDEKWVQQRLVPLFTDNSPLRFQHAWHGFLWSRPTRVALALVTPGIFYALTRLKQELSSRAERFIEFYVVVLFRYAETPLTDWTPKFFEVSNDEYRRHFTAHMSVVLRGLSRDDQVSHWSKWIADYWKLRIQGSPSPLDEVEIEHMLSWPLYLSAVFPEAVEIATLMPPAKLERSLLLHQLKKSALIEQHPEHVARHLIFYLACSGPQWLLFGIEELIKRLAQQAFQESTRTKLKERLAARGVDISSCGL